MNNIRISSSHTEVTTCDWTLAGWCCVLSSQCTNIHLMIHQCHPDLFVKCSRRMHSSIILQRYGTNVILNTSLDSDIARWWSSYIIIYYEADYISTSNTFEYRSSPLMSPTVIVIDNKCKKLTSLKLAVRTTWWTQLTKTAKIFWVTLDGAMQGGVLTSWL